MKKHSILTTCLCASIAAGMICGLPLHANASGKTTDPSTTSTGGSGGGGGSSTGGSGGGSTSTGGGSNSGGVNSNKPGVGTVSPTPSAPIVSSNLTFSASGPINGVTPLCSGSYRIDPYYPTLSLMTVNLQASSVDLADGTVLYATILTANNLYGNSSGYIILTAGAGPCTVSAYVSPGTTVTGVVISDASGNPLLVGN
jgi:hypothetical protein